MSSFTEPERSALHSAAPATDVVAGPSIPAPPIDNVMTMRGRAILLAGLLLGVVAATLVASFAPLHTADPDLARLLSAMGWIKGGIVLCAAGVLFIRFRWPVSAGAAAAYLLAVTAAAFAATMIVKLAYVGTSAFLFHLAAVTAIAVAALEGRRSRPRYGNDGDRPADAVRSDRA